MTSENEPNIKDLKDLRSRHGISQADIADELNPQIQNFSRIILGSVEAGHYIVPVDEYGIAFGLKYLRAIEKKDESRLSEVRELIAKFYPNSTTQIPEQSE